MWIRISYMKYVPPIVSAWRCPKLPTRGQQPSPPTYSDNSGCSIFAAILVLSTEYPARCRWVPDTHTPSLTRNRLYSEIGTKISRKMLCQRARVYPGNKYPSRFIAIHRLSRGLKASPIHMDEGVILQWRHLTPKWPSLL